MAATGVGSSFTILGGLTAYGALRRESGDFLAQCNAETLLTSLGVALHFFPAFIRVSCWPSLSLVCYCRCYWCCCRCSIRFAINRLDGTPAEVTHASHALWIAWDQKIGDDRPRKGFMRVPVARARCLLHRRSEDHLLNKIRQGKRGARTRTYGGSGTAKGQRTITKGGVKALRQ